MGALRHDRSGRIVRLHYETLVGRSHACCLRLPIDSVSSQHAIIAWSQEGWCVRDLSSRNGTYLNGRRIPREARAVRLAANDVLTFAERDQTWTLCDAEAPLALLVAENGDLIPLADGETTGVPNDSDPVAFLYEEEATWYLEGALGARVPLRDGESVSVAGQAYQLHLPGVTTDTPEIDVPSQDTSVVNARIVIRVAPNEEAASLELELGGQRWTLPLRAHLYLLAVLTRQRIDDAQAPDSGRKGWVTVARAMQELGLASPEGVAVMVHRCRKDVERLGCREAARLIERMRGGLLRIGLSAERCRVEALVNPDDAAPRRGSSNKGARARAPKAATPRDRSV